MALTSALAEFYWSQLEGASRVLDLGCGTGDLGRYKPPYAQVYGLDLSPSVLAEAQKWETVQHWDLDASQALPFGDGYFDAVVARDILEHLQKPLVLVSEIRRVTRVGGAVLASVISERGRRTWSDYTHVRGFTRSSVRQLFDDAGLEVRGVWRMGPVPLSSRLRAFRFVPYLLTLPPFDWIWTSSYEIKARRVP